MIAAVKLVSTEFKAWGQVTRLSNIVISKPYQDPQDSSGHGRLSKASLETDIRFGFQNDGDAWQSEYRKLSTKRLCGESEVEVISIESGSQYTWYIDAVFSAALLRHNYRETSKEIYCRPKWTDAQNVDSLLSSLCGEIKSTQIFRSLWRVAILFSAWFWWMDGICAPDKFSLYMESRVEKWEREERNHITN